MTKLFCEQEAKKRCPTLQHLLADRFHTGFYHVIKTKFTTPCGHAVECIGIGLCARCNGWFGQCRHCKPPLCLPCLDANAKVAQKAAKTLLELPAASLAATDPAAHDQPTTTAQLPGPAKAESD